MHAGIHAPFRAALVAVAILGSVSPRALVAASAEGACAPGQQLAPAAPANDNCAAPTVLPLTPFNPEVTLTLDTSEATYSTSDPEPSCAPTWRERSVWFRFDAPYDGIFSVDTTGTNYDHRVAIYGGTASGCPDPAMAVGCSFTPGVLVQATPSKGDQLAVVVSAAPGAAGSTLQVTFTFESAPVERLLLGYGTADGYPGEWWRFRGHAPDFAPRALERWDRPSGGDAVHPAVGDIYNDGEAEAVLGTGRYGRGRILIKNPGEFFLGVLYVPWPAYNDTDGAIYPAVGNLDDDPEPEIVVGLGQAGGGFFYVFDDVVHGFQPFGTQRGWYRVPWAAYNAGADGSVRPAVGDVNGDGVNEIVLGLGQGGQGYLAVLNGGPDLSLRTWLQVWWPSYNAANGETFPAAGDIDGDGRAEIVIGLGAGGQGFTEIKEDELGSFWDVGWFTTAWPAYDAFLGETHPAIGNVDGDAASEIVIGLGRFPDAGRSWVRVIDDATTGFAHIRWIGDMDDRIGARAVFPAAGVLNAPAPPGVRTPNQ